MPSPVAGRGVSLSPYLQDGQPVAVATLADRSIIGTVVLRPGVTEGVAYDVLTLLLELADPEPTSAPAADGGLAGEHTPKAGRHLALVPGAGGARPREASAGGDTDPAISSGDAPRLALVGSARAG